MTGSYLPACGKRKSPPFGGNRYLLAKPRSAGAVSFQPINEPLRAPERFADTGSFDTILPPFLLSGKPLFFNLQTGGYTPLSPYDNLTGKGTHVRIDLKVPFKLFACGLLFGTGLLGAQTTPNFGANVTILNPGMTPAQVNAALNAVNQEGQFSTNRHAVLLLPGSYGTAGNAVYADVGYYESVAGLGQTPGQVTVTGGLVADQLISGNLTQNFWRSQENLTEVPVGGETNGTLDWGVSQGASLRRMNIQGNLALVDSSAGGSTCAEASGGFTADTAVSGVTNACSQQQWYTRNSTMPVNGWQSNVWNFVFSGVTNAPAQHYPGANPGNGITTLAQTPVSREKPFLYVDASGNYFVFSPALKTNSSGTSWSGGGLGAGTSLPISSFFIAQPGNTLAQINQALASGQNLILTPGIYQYSGAISVTKPNTVVLGMGYATLVPQSGTPALSVADVDGVQIAGLLFDAGPANSPMLLEIGNPNGTNVAHASAPTSLNDVFFRIGGSTLGTATNSLQVDSGNVILDNIWAWRRSRQLRHRRLEHQYGGSRRCGQRRQRDRAGPCGRALPAVPGAMERQRGRNNLLPKRASL